MTLSVVRAPSHAPYSLRIVCTYRIGISHRRKFGQFCGSRPLCLPISWSKIKIQTTVDYTPPLADVLVDGNPVEVVEKFTYLGSIQDRTGASEAEVLRRWPIAIARKCTKALDRNVWRTSITTDITKLR